MKFDYPSSILALVLAGSISSFAHDVGAPHGDAAGPSMQPPREFLELALSTDGAAAPARRTLEEMAARYLSQQTKRPAVKAVAGEPEWFKKQASRPGWDSRMARPAWAWPQAHASQRRPLLASAALSPMSLGLNSLTFGALAFIQPPTGNGSLMAASFAPFKPKVRYYWDGTTFYEESDNMPDNMPNRMVGITSWQQQIPVPAAYFASTTNPEGTTTSLGYKQPNYWRLPLVPAPSSAHYSISSGNFQRGAVALAANGVAIFNPRNNTGNVSYEIGELDAYGGHCGLADDYHYHIIPTHLSSRFGGPLSDDKPLAWALDGYPIYGFLEPDGSARLPLDTDGTTDGGHSHGAWGYHYHAIGTTVTDSTTKHFYGTHVSPYLMSSFHGTVVNFGGQVDGQPEVGSIRQDGSGGYNAKPIAGASIVAMINPAALTTDGSGNYIENTAPGAVTSPDAYIMRVNMGGTNYDECWTINRKLNPHTLTVTWRAQALISGALSGPVVTTTNTYTPTAGTASGTRLATYTMSGASQTNLPDTGQTLDTTATFGEDADYTIHPQSFTDNGNGTITDNVTGLMWQKTDNGESTWESAVANAAGITTGGYTDWRLPTPSELFGIFNHNNANPALNTTYFPNNGAGAADYWWSSDVSGSSTTNVWCTNAGGGLGPKPKTETISAGGVLRYSARYVRGAKPTNGHNYLNNGDGTITDLDTGLMWTQIPGPATTWDAALTYAENLALGGFTDWRLPNVKELQTLTDYTLANAVTPVVKASMNQTMFAKTLTGCTTTNGGTTITCADTTGLIPGMPLVDASASDIAGAYLPYATPPTVATVTNSTTFTVNSGTGILAGTGLTLRALPPPTAFWASTSQNNATANAWVVEFGTNNTSSPARNAQGIISYNVKTGTYPVFAVRTTTVATQIAVAQGANTLTDGVSTVGYTGAGSKTFTITNTGLTSLTLNGITIDGTNASNFTLSGAPANPTTLASNASATFSVQLFAANAGSYSAALHIANNDPAVGNSVDVNLTGSIAVIDSVATSPAVPSSGDTPNVTARITPASGKTLSSAQLTYAVGSGSSTTATVFNETMANVATVSGGWDQVASPATYPWTLTFNNGNGNIQQLTAANHTTAGQGGQCGLQFSKGSSTAANSAATTNNINATGTSGYVEFYVAASNINASGLGWNLQLSTDGQPVASTTWNTAVVSELNVANHSFTKYHYDLQSGERASALKLKFNFFGNGVGGSSAPKVQIDDITVVTTTTVTPPTYTVTMYDDGTHGDSIAGDGVYTGQITQSAAKVAGAQVSYSIAANYSDSTSTTLSNAGSYTVTGPIAITTGGTLPNGLTSAPYTQSLAASGGSGSGYTWAVTGGSLPPGVTLGTNGTFSGTATAAGTYNFTVTVTDSTGHTASQAFTLTTTTPPNIVIIVTDDQGWGDIGYHTYSGRVHIDTPNLDSFATSGIRMERFYPTAVCSVTRSCLLTGRNTLRTGTNNTRGLDLSEHIMPQTFNAAGYQSFITGKWHIGGPENNICYKTINGQTVRVIQEGDEYRPYNRGWKLHYGEYGVIDAFTHYESSLLNPVTQPTWLRPDWWLNGVQYFDGDPTQNTDAEGHGGYSTDLLADKAASIITNANGDRDPTKPLLLYLPFSQIHGPVSAPPAYLAKYGTQYINGNTNTPDPHYIADVPTRTIAASVDCMDVAIGRVFSALDSMGMTNNTLVVFFSDNGGENATGGSDLPLRGAKTEPYDGGIRTPAGIRFPGKLAGGLQVPNCVTTSGTTVTCTSTSGLASGMALTGTGLAYGTTVATVPDGTHFTLSTAPTTPASGITITAGVISNMFLWAGDIFPTICAASGVTPQNTKPFDGLNMWPALQSISGANPDGTQTRFQTNPDGSKNTTTTNISPLVTVASPNVAYNTYTDPISGQAKVFKDIYSQNTSAVILTHCATVANSTTVTCDSTAGLTVGGAIYGAGIKGSATVVSINADGTHFVMSDPPNVAYASITLNVGFPTNQLFNIQDDPYETTDYMLTVNQGGLTPTQITQFNTIASAMQTSITSINPNVYPPYVGPTLITNSAAQGSATQLYVPFTSYAKNAPIIQWRKNGVNLTDGTTASGSTITGSTTFTQNTTAPDAGYGNPSVPTNGAYNSVLTITNVTTSDAGSYDVVINNVDTYQVPNVTNTVTSPAGTFTVAPNPPVLAALPAFTKGTSQTVTWPAVATATGYTVQMSGTANFASVLATQTVNTTSAIFTGLTHGNTYYFRATATDGVTSSVFSNVVSSTQDTGNPTVAITSPTNGFGTTQGTITVQGTASDTLSGIASVTVEGVAATTANNYATWSAANVPLNVGTNTLTATATDGAGNTNITSVIGTYTPTVPVISGVTSGPTAPTYLDPVYVTAQVQAGYGAGLSQVQLLYDLGTPVSATVFREAFGNTSTNNWPNGANSTAIGAQNQWFTPGTTAVRQAIGASNNTTPIVLAGCSTNGTTTATCASTASLWPGMLITGPNIPGSTNGTSTGNTKINSITNATTFELSQAASGSGSNLTLTAAGVTLTNCTTVAGSAVTCDSTAGLVNGMALTGTGLANNATVASVTSATSFTMNAAPTTPGSALTLTASGAAAEFQNTSATAVTIETASAINLTGATAGYVEFYIETRDLAATSNNSWTFAVMDKNNLWHDRVVEDWNSKTVTLANCVLNTTGSTSGSTTVTCTSTTGLTTGRSVAGPNVYVTGTASPTSPIVTGTDTTNLKVGMFISGSAGIPNGTRILTIDSATQFTMSVNSTVASAQSVTFAATSFAANATVSSITNTTTFVLSTAAYVNTTAAPISATATTLNHGFTKYHYDLDPSTEVNGSIKLRFSATGYNPTSPTRGPRVDVDDVVVVKTTAPPTVAVVMVDDGLHGDGAAGDGTYGAQIPVQAGSTAVSYRVSATDTNSATTTSSSASFTVNPYLTDAVVTNAEFLTIPTDQGVTITMATATDQDAYVQYGTSPGSYPNSTAVTSFAVANGPMRIALTGLQPNTKYYYRLRHRATGSGVFNARGERSFRTARPRGSSFVFTVTADPHLDFNTDPALLTRAMANLAVDQPDFHVDLGDIFMTDKMTDTVAGVPAQYGGGPLSQSSVNLRASIFRNFFELACHSVPYFYTLGNHEAEYGYLFNAATDKQNNIPAWNLKARKAYYPAPTPNSFYAGNGTPMSYTGGTLGMLEDYYAWEWGDALFIVLDPFWNTLTNPNQVNDAWNWSLGKPQYDWLKATLQNSSAKYKFVFMHHIIGGTATLADGTTPNVAARGGVEVADKYEWGGRNADGSDGFTAHRSGWDMPIHNLLVANKVNVVFHGHDHLYGYQTLDGIVYLECPQPGTANYVTLGSAGDGKYTQGVLLPNSGHIRVSVGSGQTLAEYVRAYRPSDENATTHNRDVSHSFTMAPRIFPPIEMIGKAGASASFRWNAVPNKPYTVQWSPDLVNWATIDTVTFPAVNTNGTYTDTNNSRVGSNQSKGYYRVSYTP